MRVEGSEGQAHDILASAQFRHELPNWMTARQFAGAHRANQHDRALPKIARKVAEELAAGAVRPMQVLDDQEQWSPGGGSFDERQKLVQERKPRARTLVGGVAALGQQRGQR